MKLPFPSLPALAVCIAVSAGCLPTRTQVDASAVTGPRAAPTAVELVASPLATLSPSAQPSVEATAPPAERAHPAQVVGERLALAWCLEGGTSFGALASDDGLSSCKEVGSQVSELRTDGALTTAIIELSVSSRGSEEQRYLYLEAGGRIGAFQLARGYSSGIGGFSHSLAVENVQVRDVHGDDTLEWSAEIVSEQHDADMGLCAVTGTMERDFVLCTTDAGSFACLDVPLSRLEYEEHAPMVDDVCGPTKTTSGGFTQLVTVERGAIRVARDPKAAPFSKPTTPPLRGRLNIGELLKTAAVKRSSLF